MKKRWRLYKSYFNGPGEYQFNDISLTVEEDRTFECDQKEIHAPLYTIAALVGGKRDLEINRK